MSSLNEEDSQLPSQLSQHEINQTVNKIANFLDMKNIYISQFWQSNRNYACSQDIEKFCQLCGLKLGIHDQMNLKTQLFSQREVISIYQFCDLIPQWKKKGSQMIADFLKQRSEQLVQNLNVKHKNQRIKSSSGHHMRLGSMNSTVTTFDIKKNRLYSASKQQIKQYKRNNSKKYLQQNRLKNLKRQQQLAQTIQKTKNQHQYNMLMKMNELNEYHHKNKSSTTYRAYKNAQGTIKVRVFQLETFRKQLTIQEFESEYKIYKKSTKQNKHWQRPMSTKQANSNDVLMTKILQNATSGNISKNQKKQQRQQELKKLLVNTINLTKLLQEQIKIFKMKGINGA